MGSEQSLRGGTPALSCCQSLLWLDRLSEGEFTVCSGFLMALHH